ncbi:MAG: head-tail connector protein [Phycisphaerae bacterium]
MTTPPVAEPVSLSDMKDWIRQDQSFDNNLIMAQISAARATIEQWTGLQIMPAAFTLQLDQFPIPQLGVYSPGSPFTEAPIMSNRFPITPDIWAIRVKKFPLIAVNSIVYVDGNQTQQTLATSAYSVDTASRVPRIWPSPGGYWPTSAMQPGAVQISFTAGFQGAGGASDTTAVPTPIIQAIKLLASHWYENREAVSMGVKPTALPMGVDSLIAEYKVSPL